MFEVLSQDFRELVRGRHDEALIGVRPVDEVLNSLILQHAVELVNESSLHNLWSLRSSCGTCCSIAVRPSKRARLSVSIHRAITALSLFHVGTIALPRPWRAHVGRGRRGHNGIFLDRFGRDVTVPEVLRQYGHRPWSRGRFDRRAEGVSEGGLEKRTHGAFLCSGVVGIKRPSERGVRVGRYGVLFSAHARQKYLASRVERATHEEGKR